MVRVNGMQRISLLAGLMFASQLLVRLKQNVEVHFFRRRAYYLMFFTLLYCAAQSIPHNLRSMNAIAIGFQFSELGALMNVTTVRSKVKIRKKLLRRMARNNSSSGAVHLMFRPHRLTITINILKRAIPVTKI